jgi:alcohol dehydrogenase class IV
MMNFDFMSPSRILVKTGGLKDLGSLAKPFGSHALLVTRSKSPANEEAHRYLEQGHIKVTRIFSKGEPTLDSLSQSLSIARKNNIDFVVALGGGSVIDTGKMLAALMQNKGDILDYVEVIGKGIPITNPSLPFIAIPTTSGTGAEVTKNGVLSFPNHQAKVSLRSPYMLADLVLLDASLTLSVPQTITAYTGLDALTQVIEPFVSTMANPISDAFAKEGIILITRSFKKAYNQPHNLEAREDMAIASLFGGLALSNAKLGAVHGFAGPLGGMYPIPHGIACASLLPFVVEANIKALQEIDSNHSILDRYKEIAVLLTGNPKAEALDSVAWLRKLSTYMKIPTLKTFNIKKEHAQEIIEKAKQSSSMKGNPVVLSDDQLKTILFKAL